MPRFKPLTFAVAVNNDRLFERNFLASPCVQGSHHHQILAQRGFESAAKAYNNAIDRSESDLMVFAHQDIFLPASFLLQLEVSLDWLQVHAPAWGVLGSYGKTVDGRGWGHVYSSGRGIIGQPLHRPVPVQTLDEIVLIFRRSSGLKFDERIENFHFYGAAICLAAAQLGLTNYAISAFCIHNTQQNLVQPREFYQCYRQLRRIWKNHLPIQTTCVRVSRWNMSMCWRKLQETYLRHIRRKLVGAHRLDDISSLRRQFEAAAQAEHSTFLELPLPTLLDEK